MYCSGNNLIILEDTSVLLQTIYLQGDGKAVKIEPSSGRIAISDGNQIQILNPIVIYDQPLKWEEYCIIPHSEVTALDWSNKDELIAGSISLTVWDLSNTPNVIWSKSLALPISQLQVSPDSSLIATVGENDRLVKVWRRTSFDIQYTQFDFVYLSHPKPIRKLQWRLYGGEEDACNSPENALYTFSQDDLLRVWMPYDSLDSSNLQIWGTIPIQNENAFILPSYVLDKSIEHAKNTSKSFETSIGLTNAIKLQQRHPDVCISINSDKHIMSAYSIENLGEKKRQQKRLVTTTKVIEKQIPQLIDCSGLLNFIPYPPKHRDSSDTTTSRSGIEPEMSVLVHDMLRGVLYQYTISVRNMLDRSGNTVNKKTSAWTLRTILTGHNKSVQSISRGNDGESLFSKSRFNENYIWKPKKLSNSITLKRSSLLQGDVLTAALLCGGDFVVTLSRKLFDLELWDCRLSNAQSICKISTPEELHKEPLCFFLAPENIGSECYHHVIAIYDNIQNIRVWRIQLPTTNDPGVMLLDMGNFGIPKNNENDPLLIATPVDPVGWSAKLDREFFDSYQRDVLATITKSGTIQTWTAQIQDNDTSSSVEWLETGKVETGEESILRAQVSSTQKIAAVNEQCTKLTIWDVKNQLMEFEEIYKDTISDLDWTSAPDGQSVLGVGFSSRQVLLYCQLRFDYTNNVPAWAPFKRVDISTFTTHPIGDSIWLRDGAFVTGAGNQFFIQDNRINPNDRITREMLDSRMSADYFSDGATIFDVCAVLNGPLPFYHPQLLIQSIFAGKIDVVKSILVGLLKQLKFSPEVTSNLDIPDIFTPRVGSTIASGRNQRDEKQRLFRRNSYADHNDDFNETVYEQLQEWVQRVSLPYLTRHQQITLASVVEALAQTDIHRRSLDENGIKFLLGYKLYKIHTGQKSMTVRDFNWALHSESQDILLQIIEKGAGSNLLWPSMREVGYAYWLRDEKLKEQFEVLGRNYFNQDGKRDPTACALYYLALRKKQILLGLWRTASSNKEQGKTMKLLSQDFTQPRWRSAALKNAFALIGKHRYEYAAAFFLLGDSLKDAVNVLIRNVEDVSLAIAVTRVYEKDPDKPVLRKILMDHVLPIAERDGDRWTMSWAWWVLDEREKSIQSLAFGQRQELEKSIKDAKSFLVDDPVLVVLYRYLRDQSLKTTNAGGTGYYEGLKIGHELEFISKVASIYGRMGCEVLALDLVTRWQFIHQDTKKPTENNNRPTLVEAGRGLSKDSVLTKSSAANGHAYNGEMNGGQTTNGNAETNDGSGILKQNYKPVSSQAFEEPDMSAFDFGF